MKSLQWSYNSLINGNTVETTVIYFNLKTFEKKFVHDIKNFTQLLYIHALVQHKTINFHKCKLSKPSICEWEALRKIKQA